ncbi:MAG: DUF1232 domain-containing protein [Bdellovibrionaceae bacterium]|nr:DUF1232 domain-containing protein [Pseudobdellovibrionaceae bacterium]|tara:strand:- start:12472 stop:12693 length:222 start_codon:yes stop_codon:yes gene_type:complete
MKKGGTVIVALFCVIYLLNPTAGLFEIIPDQIPFFGNIDEASITALLIYCLKKLGIIFKEEKQKKEIKQEKEF